MPQASGDNNASNTNKDDNNASIGQMADAAGIIDNSGAPDVPGTPKTPKTPKMPKTDESQANDSSEETRRELNDMRQSQLSHVLYWRFFVNIALACCDAAMFLIGGATVSNLRGETGPFWSVRFHLWVSDSVFLVITSCLWVWCLYRLGVYHRHVMGDGYRLNMKLFFSAVQCGLALCALVFLLDLRITLVNLILIVLAGFALTLLERLISRLYITRTRRHGAYAYATVLVGSPKGMAKTLRFLDRRQQLNYRTVALCPVRLNEETGLIEADRDVKTLQELILDKWPELKVIEYSEHGLAETFVREQIQTVMVTDVFRRFSDNFNIFSVRMESLGLEIALISSAADIAGHETQVRSIQGTTIVTYRLPQYSMKTRIVKRLFDLVVSSLAIVLSLIITLPVAIAIKLTDGGPVFYTQKRIGLRGKPFRMIKFRSMVVNADALKAKLAAETGQKDRFIFKMKDDPRITKVGHFIRRFSIDELPQFLNVWMGDMSVVGPRPPLPEEYARYNRVYATRMLVKPGITGPWQVSGRSDLSAEQSEALDVSYVQDWSISGDINLMFRTVSAVLSHKGAY
ncbi:exopolysaccharide biosynthesis polyprenyl glycosylphosphotransferase [Bifidobacterium callitrichos DSM 23973]|uniref:Exopolysaccharide biosynthesis polyprenyl glycosylphosphotransferase n=2 Tax=Bifidobacterium callitrichos TaxID=762209 RepID=A0A087A7B4_9BIFI|nr:exopolysaccharide biosynthesis polyprenyl glycosylphosphotransferase [Bifidobacterium callitrichos DSM 23973]